MLWSPAIQVVHIVWCTHARERLVDRTCDEELAAFLRRKASELKSQVLACGNADDHVHVLARLHTAVALATLVQRLKGASSHDLGLRWPAGLRWQEGYWAQSVSPSHLERVAAYVREQRSHHADPRLRESWMEPEGLAPPSGA